MNEKQLRDMIRKKSIFQVLFKIETLLNWCLIITHSQSKITNRIFFPLVVIKFQSMLVSYKENINFLS